MFLGASYLYGVALGLGLIEYVLKTLLCAVHTASKEPGGWGGNLRTRDCLGLLAYITSALRLAYIRTNYADMTKRRAGRKERNNFRSL